MKRVLTLCIVTLVVFCSSCEDLLEVPDISEKNVELLAPSDSTLVAQNDVNFTWNEVYEATQYHVQIASPSFENATQIVIDTLVVIDSSYTSPSFTRTLPNSAYEWRVKAMNSDYETPFTMHHFSVNGTGN